MAYEYKVIAFLSQGKFVILGEKPPQVGEARLSRWEVVHTENMLNEMSREGWEFVSAVVYQEESVGTIQEYYFKRPLSQT